MQARRVGILDFARSPIARAKNGALNSVSGLEIAAQVVKSLFERNATVPKDRVEHLALGVAFPEAENGLNLARALVVKAGLPETVAGSTVNQFCGSSQQSTMMLADALALGKGDIAVSVGLEHMTRVPMGGFNPMFDKELAELEFYMGMGETAENLAKDGNISREAQDDFAIASHQKAVKAWEDGAFASEVVAITLPDGSEVTQDECPRTPDEAKIRSLRPAFLKDGTVTAASSSPVTVGAAAIILIAEDTAKELGLEVKAWIASTAVAGVDWKRMGRGPVPATKKALDRAGLSLDEIDVIELNEAFAAQSLYVIDEAGFSPDKVNILGGAIALGHPLGMSGARIIGTAITALEKQGGTKALATMCVGGGQGVATVLVKDETMAKIRTVAVIGSGIMGSGIAAFFADRGCDVQLYDLEKELVQENLAKLTHPKTKPPPILDKRAVSNITAHGLDEMDEYLSGADLIVEAVPEILKIKRITFENVDKARRDGSIIASNTSGLSITSMADGRSEDFQKHFLGCHFFNPVRYMPLVELIPVPTTDPGVLQQMKGLLRAAGKSPVIGKDTPNFIANRVGVYSMMKALELTKKYDLTIEEVDALTGPAIGAPKTGTYRLADMVGLDTLVKVAKNSFENCPDDEARDVFQTAGVLDDLVADGRFGDKTRKGFYQKTVDAEGNKAILSVDLATLEYRPQAKARITAIGAVKMLPGQKDKLNGFLGFSNDDKHVLFARELVLAVGAYALNRIGEICDSAEEVDLALRAGFNRDIGPIETLDMIGLAKAKTWMEELGIAVPARLAKAVEAGEKRLSSRPAPREGTISVKQEIKAGKVVHQNMSAKLIDLGDGVLLCEPASFLVPSMNPVDDQMIAMMDKAHEEITAGKFQALVIGNQAKNFCAGANLMLVLELAKSKQFEPIRQVTAGLQQANLRNLYAPYPVITCPHGMTLGGGLEIAMGGQQRVAYAELYAGLVEVGVGLIPAGGGCFFLLRQMTERMKKGNPGYMPPVGKAFELIGFGTVSSSAFDAKGKTMLVKGDEIVFSKDEQIAKAKAMALAKLDNFEAIEKKPLLLPGEGGRLALEDNIDGMRKAGKISAHSAVIARHQANILTGGRFASPVTPVTPEQVLELEREAFLSLCGEEKTQERMAHMLKRGKPLMN